ncbi:Iron-dependent repressor IdeR [Frondihabitans sp. 762G35]|uniref:metal-dependent transcriptional regulator n=1 Tax=Frondihabitans sp. 762G35 TaxID=1446794 RepID=UPI000D216980|nr:metal-dependent transcriptional regulator [Frondihabitans sp. 762G35]ARC58043.1 Iron-dependent repressor IdeR [Frondihabitans sp. 762G35]
MDIDSITPVAQDFVKAIWSATEWGDPPITTKELAARFGTTPASVTDTVRRLASQGLVDYEPYRPVTLTELGASYAVAMVRRHRLLETFLVTTLGYGWEEVHDEAERLEHAASNALIERIDALLGHPAADPHGDPIPEADGRTTMRPGVARLASAPAGDYLVVRVSDRDPDRLDRAAQLGLVPGAGVTVAAAPLPDVADAVWVVPAVAGAPS